MADTSVREYAFVYIYAAVSICANVSIKKLCEVLHGVAASTSVYGGLMHETKTEQSFRVSKLEETAYKLEKI